MLGGSSDDGVLRNQPADSLPPETFEAWTRFHQAAEQLPDEQREVFHLVWYGGLPQREIASLLGVSIPTVKRRLRSARLLLHAALQGESPLVGEDD